MKEEKKECNICRNGGSIPDFDGEKILEKNFNTSNYQINIIQFVIKECYWVCREIRDELVNDNQSEKRYPYLRNNGCWHPHKTRADRIYKGDEIPAPKKSLKHHLTGILIKGDDNTAANVGFKKMIMGTTKEADSLKNWDVCHIYNCIRWTNENTRPYEHYTELANMILVPKALHSFTEFPVINDLLKYRSWELYDYKGNSRKHPDEPELYSKIEWPNPVCYDYAEAVKRIKARSNTI